MKKKTENVPGNGTDATIVTVDEVNSVKFVDPALMATQHLPSTQYVIMLQQNFWFTSHSIGW